MQPVHRHAAGEAVVVVVVVVGVGVTNDVRKVKSWNKKLEQKQKPEANIKLVTSSVDGRSGRCVIGNRQFRRIREK